MAKVLLDKEDSFIAASNAIFLGNTGLETVKILNDSIEVTTDSSVDKVEFIHKSSDYTYKTNTTGMQILYNNKVIANVAGGQNLVFTDGMAAVAIGAFDLATLKAPITLNGKTVPSVASSLDIFSTTEAPTPAPTEMPTTAPTEAPTTIGSGDVIPNATVTATSSIDIFNLILNNGVNYTTTISGFNYAYDKIQIPINQPIPLAVAEGVNNVTDGNVDLTWLPISSQNTITIKLINLDNVTEAALQQNAVPQVFTTPKIAILLTSDAQTLTGTENDDLFEGNLSNLDKDTIFGGTGTDTLKLTGVAGAINANIKEIETLDLALLTGNSTLAVTTTNFGSDLKTINLSGTGSLSISGTAADVNLNGVNLTSLSGSGKITSNGNSANTIKTINNSSAITVLGQQALTITDALPNLGTGKFDASAASGIITVTAGNFATAIVGGKARDSLTGGTENDSISGGDGNDTITSGGGVDTLTGGDGDDKFVFNLSNYNPNTIGTITDLANGTDIIKLGGLGTNMSFSHLPSTTKNNEIYYDATTKSIVMETSTGDKRIALGSSSINVDDIKFDSSKNELTISSSFENYLTDYFTANSALKELSVKGLGNLTVTIPSSFTATDFLIQDYNWTGATTHSIDGSSFTGKLKVVMAQPETNDKASFSIQSGNGDDTVHVVTKGIISSSLITTGAGNDSIILNDFEFNNTLTSQEKMTISAGRGTDNIYLNQTHKNAVVIQQYTGDSQGGIISRYFGSDYLYTKGLDVISHLKTNDILNLVDYKTSSEKLIVHEDYIKKFLGFPTAPDNSYYRIDGFYNAYNDTFTQTFSPSADSLFIYDSDPKIGTLKEEIIVLVGISPLKVTLTATADGVISFPTSS